MFKIIRTCLAASIFALLLIPQGVYAQEGIVAKDVAEWPVDNPGIEKVVLQRFEIASSSRWMRGGAASSRSSVSSRDLV